jgi:glycosyltransferase involved in cell wall biosynthesis
MIEGYIEKSKRKKILLLSDDMRMHSGVATMSRELVVGSAHKYNWFQVGAALKHPDQGKVLDISTDVNGHAGITDADVKIMPNEGYGNSMLIRSLLKSEKPDAIFIFTDPRYWIWLFEIEREIRNKIPIIWLNIWDDYPAPMYNRDYYNSVDCLMGISKQTVNINRLVLGEDAANKVTKYVPHKHFYPIDEDHNLYPELVKFKESTLGQKDFDFVVYFNSRNIHRKRPGDVILAFKHFCDLIGEEKAKKVALVMHTEVSNPHGTDLRAVKEALHPKGNVYFSTAKISSAQMNFMYNMCDVTALISSNEGWGLSLTESMMSGTMIVGAVTGGMQDQLRFEDEKGDWIDFNSDFPSNHRGTYKKCGEWAEPVFPSNISLAGSPMTPYIYDDRSNPEDVANAIKKIYDLPKDERDRRGKTGSEWAKSEEAQMTAEAMCKNMMDGIEETFKKFKPRKRFDIFKAEGVRSEAVTHKLTGY